MQSDESSSSSPVHSLSDAKQRIVHFQPARSSASMVPRTTENFSGVPVRWHSTWHGLSDPDPESVPGPRRDRPPYAGQPEPSSSFPKSYRRPGEPIESDEDDRLRKIGWHVRRIQYMS